MEKNVFKRIGLISLVAVLTSGPLYSQAKIGTSGQSDSNGIILIFLFLMVLVALFAAVYLYSKVKEIKESLRKRNADDVVRFEEYINLFDSKQIEKYLDIVKKNKRPGSTTNTCLFALIFSGSLFSAHSSFAQTGGSSSITGGGFIITLVLILIPIIAGIILLIVKIRSLLRQFKDKENLEEGEKLAEYLKHANSDALEQALMKRKLALDYTLSNNELSGENEAEDVKGLLQHVSSEALLPLVAAKKRATKRPAIDPQLAKLVLWFICSAAFWLILGTTVGEYLGIKFVAPDVDHYSWLSFGRLRPVHTNMVFWGWASLGMLGLGFYIVPRVSNTPLASIRLGWYTLILINAAVILGTLCLMAGINNGGGEYREYIWPIMLLFAVGVILTLINFIKTIANRTTKEIYISNWYMVAALMFVITIAVTAYIPAWQDGLGETIVQGYYMHQGVGMWFMLFTLGIVYYFLPQQLNKPIYSYSLGILAFWTQILFYTVIGTHHFVFSSIPWWLQTTAIVGSVGMVIPVAAGTTNFLLTFNGAWYKVPSSYTLPFFIVGIIFYFTGSLQGTAEAFRSANLIWHFTDFTVAHSHLTMYGIICFFLWAGIYALVPRLTGKEAPQITIGAHFWLALIGLLFYTVPLMYGSTMKGKMWMEGKPFIDSVVFMAPYWLWRAIGGSLMWLSHLFFGYNLYKMLVGHTNTDVREAAIERLNQSYADSTANQDY
jgi:cytochrome c oxidase cbb3-type subunit 1